MLGVLTASSSLNSILKCAIAEASVQDVKLLAGPGVRAKPDVATVGLVCKVMYLSPKLRSAIIEEERQEDQPEAWRMTSAISKLRHGSGRR